MKRLLTTLLIAMTISSVAYGQIDDVYRNANAQVIYDFAETSGVIVDKSKIGAPLNLEVYHPSAIRTAGEIALGQANVVRSVSPADKITNACKASGAMSIEVTLTNADTVLLRSGMDEKKRNQPLRIVSLSKGLFDRNFVFGLFYNMGNLYDIGVKTSVNEPDANALGNSLKDPLESIPSTTIVPDTPTGRGNPQAQKLIFTLGPSGIARLYLSDRTGSLYLAHTETQGFGSAPANQFLSNWKTGAYLTLGNESMSKTEFATYAGLNDAFTGCSKERDATDYCYTNPNRWWKGKLNLVAIYCNEIPKEQITGAGMLSLLKALKVDLSTIPNSISADRKRAMDIFSRINSVKTPVTNPILDRMESEVHTGNLVGAAEIAMEDKNFLNITVRDFAARFSSRDLTVNTPLNDLIATVIGAVRDNVSAQKLLTENMVYVGNTKAPASLPVPNDPIDDFAMSNNHYLAIDNGKFDLSNPDVLIRQTQKIYSSRTQKLVELGDDSAGLLTTRQWMASHAVAGTSRRLVQYSLQEFLCSPLEKIGDASGPDDVVGADIDRHPGGSHSKYTTTCRGCHTIMDGLRPAFAKWTFSNNFAKHADYTTKFVKMNANDDENNSMGMEMNPDGIAYKNNKNSDVFKDACTATAGQNAGSIGCLIKDESWVNNASRNSNASRFQWTKLSGRGLKAYGQMLAESPMFAKCMADRVFRAVCKRAPQTLDNKLILESAKEFSTQRQYNLRYLFQKIGSSDECLGGTNE